MSKGHTAHNPPEHTMTNSLNIIAAAATSNTSIEFELANGLFVAVDSEGWAMVLTEDGDEVAMVYAVVIHEDIPEHARQLFGVRNYGDLEVTNHDTLAGALARCERLAA